MRIKVNRRSAAYKRVISAGFRIRNINLRKIVGGSYEEVCYAPVVSFVCICGTKEYINGLRYFRENIPKQLDVAQMMEDANALSIEHLIEDGYSKDEIKRIRKAYDN